mgnify:CR=1 FL=1
MRLRQVYGVKLGLVFVVFDLLRRVASLKRFCSMRQQVEVWVDVLLQIKAPRQELEGVLCGILESC